MQSASRAQVHPCLGSTTGSRYSARYSTDSCWITAKLMASSAEGAYNPAAILAGSHPPIDGGIAAAADGIQRHAPAGADHDAGRILRDRQRRAEIQQRLRVGVLQHLRAGGRQATYATRSRRGHIYSMICSFQKLALKTPKRLQPDGLCAMKGRCHLAMSWHTHNPRQLSSDGPRGAASDVSQAQRSDCLFTQLSSMQLS